MYVCVYIYIVREPSETGCGCHRVRIPPVWYSLPPTGRVDIRLPGKGNSNSHGARSVHYNHLVDQVDSEQ